MSFGWRNEASQLNTQVDNLLRKVWHVPCKSMWTTSWKKEIG